MAAPPSRFRIDDVRGREPVVLIFAPSDRSPAFENQISLLQDDVSEDLIFVVQVLVEGACYAGKGKLDEPSARELRQQYAIGDDDFAVVMLDKEGRERYRGDAPVQPEFLHDKISTVS